MNELPEECIAYLKSQKEKVNCFSTTNVLPRRDILPQKDPTMYLSASHARICRLIYLVDAGLNDSEIIQEMNSSIGLHWHEKPHLHDEEIRKARRYVANKRGH